MSRTLAPLEASLPERVEGGRLADLCVRHSDRTRRLAYVLCHCHLAGLEYAGDIADGTGRPGIAIGLTSFGERHELIIDPDTGALLGERHVQVDPGPFSETPGPGEGINANGIDDPGTVNYWAAYLSSGIVDSTDGRP